MSLNWCPAFARAPGTTTLSVQLQPPMLTGIYQQSPTSAVFINSPGNGEVVYGPAGISYPLNVLGRVFYQGNLSDVKLTLEILADNGFSTTLQSAPLPDGTFSFLLEGNHGANEPVSMLSNGTMVAGEAPCLECHKNNFDGSLPAKGTVQLKVSLSTSAGVQATDMRVISVDPGGIVAIPVHVLFPDNQPAANIPILADGRLYEWRERSSTATSDSRGQAGLQVEALSQNPTSYQVSIPPTVINGFLYESRDSIQVVLPPGATTAPAITLHVQQVSGAIRGNVSGLAAPVRVWAISPADGSVHIATTTVLGVFTFDNLPVTRYLLAGDPQELAKQGLALPAESIDLTQSPSAQVNLVPQPLKGTSLTGKVSDSSSAALPFAWVSLGSQTGQTFAASGTYSLFGLTAVRATVIVNAPGYYSQANSIAKMDPSGSTLDFSLVRRPDTLSIPWGAGAVVLPADTLYSLNGQTISFTQGWLWGQGQSEKPLVIQFEDMQISLPAGHFALERLPAGPAFLYIMAGQASIQQTGTTLSIPVQAGQMVLLSQGQVPAPVPYDPVAAWVFHAASAAPVSPFWQPGLGAQLRDRLARIGIGTAQAVTFITYLMEVLALLAMGFLAVKWVIKVIIKQRNEKSVTNLSPMDRQETLTGEMLLLNMLGRIFYTYPTDQERAWLQTLIDQDIFSEAPFAADQKLTGAGLELLQDWARPGLSDEGFKSVQADYTRLFIGLGDDGFAAPWESVYFSEERLVFQQQTLEVRNWYRRFGLEAEKINREPDDHIGLELLFMSHLAGLGLQLLDAQDEARFEECWAAQRDFHKQHLGAWALAWCELVEANAQTDFYKGLAYLTHGALFALSEMLDDSSSKDSPASVFFRLPNDFPLLTIRHWS